MLARQFGNLSISLGDNSSQSRNLCGQLLNRNASLIE